MLSGQEYLSQIISKNIMEHIHGDQSFRNENLNDYVVDSDESENSALKQVSARITENLYIEIEEAVFVLGISKRKFIETALIAAISEFQEEAFKAHILKERSI